MAGVSPGAGHEAARSAVDRSAGGLTRPLLVAWAQIQLDVARLRERWPVESPPVRVRRLASLEAKVARLLAAAQAEVRGTLPTVVRDVFDAAGVVTSGQLGSRLAWSDADLAVIDAVTADLWADLVDAIAFTRASATSLTRALTRLAGAIPELRVETEQALRRELDTRGIAAVVYRDGSRHGLAEYARMAARTKLAQAWQVAGLRVMAGYGVEWVEVLDGVGCGWASHADTRKASGLIVTVAEAETHPISHPNCIRTTYPRLDITSEAGARAAAPNADATAGGGKDLQLPARAVRGADGLFNVRAGAVVSPALARHMTYARQAGPGVVQQVSRVSRVSQVSRVSGGSGG